MNNYYLKEKTLLDGKYTIAKVIGEGGFGITYEAENRKISLKVAIKELYIKGLMNRNVLESDDVLLIHEGSEHEFEKAKIRFLNEAKTLSGFSNEAGLVHILDYFEENGTAYIVMNYIEGITLQEYIKQNGVLSWTQTVDLIKPILLSLEKLHETGVIHRDISSNNIMVMEDGAACLIDFGTTKDIIMSNNTNTTVVYSKRGYTPLEQLAESGKVGPWSDIYAIMAVCYECITGKMPPDVLQRTVFDEYTTLKDNKIHVPKLFDEILSKGLTVDYKKRYQSIRELLLDIDNLLKTNSKESKNKKTVILGILLCCVLIIAISFFLNCKTFIFYGKETEEFCIFMQDDITIKDLENNINILRGRIESLVGDEPYLFDVDNESIHCVIPTECFQEEDVQSVINNLLLFKNDMVFCLDNGDYSIDKQYIEDLSFEEGFIKILFSNDTPETVIDRINNDRLLIELKDYAYYECFRIDQLDDYEFLFDCQAGDNINQLIVTIYQQEKFTASCDYILDIKAEWENTENSDYVGKYQRNKNKFLFDYVTLKYESSNDFSEGEWLDLMISLKKRLDILGIPYAIGIGNNQNRNIITIRVNQRDYNEDLFGLINFSSYNIEICDEWYRPLETTVFLSDMKFEQVKDGIIVTIDNNSEYDGWDECITNLSSLGLTQYHIMLNDFTAFDAEPYGDVKDKKLIMDKIYFDNGAITEDNKVLLDLLNSILYNIDYDFSSYSLETIQYTGLFQKITQKPKHRLDVMVYDKQRYESFASYVQDYNKELTVSNTLNWNEYDVSLRIQMPRELYYESKNDPQIVTEMITDIMDLLEVEKGMLYKGVYIGLPSKEDGFLATKISIHRGTSLTPDAPYSIAVVGFDKDETVWLEKIYEELKEQPQFENDVIEFHDLSDE